ncbi:hypothetical protein Lepto7375DRAFT_7285 [Leptolyngbya sp. PCC 7375]|nr:hypothetical protein Lepto7375DRAFT_7285 [Leptolyngbya sp. PCC 7375]
MANKTITVDSTFPDPDNPNEVTEKVARFRLLGADRVCISLFNDLDESVTLTGFKIAFFSSETSKKAVDGPSTAEEWTNPEQFGVILNASQIGPQTLAAGERLIFWMHRLNPAYAIQLLATAGSTGKLKIDLGRGDFLDGTS